MRTPKPTPPTYPPRVAIEIIAIAAMRTPPINTRQRLRQLDAQQYLRRRHSQASCRVDLRAIDAVDAGHDVARQHELRVEY